jgi:hypothetical protein
MLRCIPVAASSECDFRNWIWKKFEVKVRQRCCPPGVLVWDPTIGSRLTMPSKAHFGRCGLLPDFCATAKEVRSVSGDIWDMKKSRFTVVCCGDRA